MAGDNDKQNPNTQAAVAAAATTATLKKKQAAANLNEKPEVKQETQKESNEKLKNPAAEQSVPPTTSKQAPNEALKPRSSELEHQPSPPDQNTVKRSETDPSTLKSPTDLATENAHLTQTLTRLQSDLTEAQDHIFSLQPRHELLTESDVITLFTSLSCAIENWVDVHLANALDEKDIPHEEVLNIEDIQNLLNLIPPSGKSAFGVSGTDVDNIQALVWRYICDVIFSQDFYCPLPRHEREFLVGVERGMRCLTPRRDTRAIRHWRIETYSAATQRPGFTEYAEARQASLTTHLAKALLPFAGEDSFESLSKSLHECIIKPAFELGRKVHLCLDEYTLEWSAYHDRTLGDAAKVFEEEAAKRFGGYEFVSVSDRRTLRERPKPKGEGEEGNGVKVKWLFDLAPKLVFRRLRADSWSEGKVLVKPKVLVKVFKPRKMPVSGVRKEDGYRTVLGEVQGWLEREVHLLEREREREREKMRLKGVRQAGFMGIFS